MMMLVYIKQHLAVEPAMMDTDIPVVGNGPFQENQKKKFFKYFSEKIFKLIKTFRTFLCFKD